jgi:hypothetical protein
MRPCAPAQESNKRELIVSPGLPEMEDSMKKLIFYFLMALFISGGVIAMNSWSQDSADRRQPELSGMTQGNTGCAVLEKHTPIKGKLLALGVIYARTQYVVLDTVNCKLPKDKYTGPGDIKELNQYAVNNRIKLVVIPRNYTDQELQDAKNMCREKSSSQPTSATSP